jgi:hypothetical protein
MCDIEPPDWATELIAAGALIRTKQIDARGNPIYRVGRFPDGPEGQRLRELFDQNVKRVKP